MFGVIAHFGFSDSIAKSPLDIETLLPALSIRQPFLTNGEEFQDTLTLSVTWVGRRIGPTPPNDSDRKIAAKSLRHIGDMTVTSPQD